MIVNSCIENVKSCVMIEKNCIEIWNEIKIVIEIWDEIEIEIEIKISWTIQPKPKRAP